MREVFVSIRLTLLVGCSKHAAGLRRRESLHCMLCQCHMHVAWQLYLYVLCYPIKFMCVYLCVCVCEDEMKESPLYVVSSQSEYRDKERCRSLEFFQTTWISICRKVILGFWHDDNKNKLPPPALSSSKGQSITFRFYRVNKFILVIGVANFSGRDGHQI